MGALTNSRNTPEKEGKIFEAVPVAAATKIFVGALVAVDSSGNAKPAADTAGLRVIGRCDGVPGPGVTGLDADNSGGAAGDVKVNVKRGTFKFDNKGTDLVTKAEIGKACYVEDDQTVRKSAGTGAVKAGIVVGLDDSNASVWVDTGRAGPSVTTADGSDPATTQALANALKATFNAA